jgi:hypothetical protein
MKLKYIGTDRSMGLKHGEEYRIGISSHTDDTQITIYWFNAGSRTDCLYSSPAAFAANWAKPGEPQKVVVRKKGAKTDGHV